MKESGLILYQIPGSKHEYDLILVLMLIVDLRCDIIYIEELRVMLTSIFYFFSFFAIEVDLAS